MKRGEELDGEECGGSARWNRERGTGGGEECIRDYFTRRIVVGKR